MKKGLTVTAVFFQRATPIGSTLTHPDLTGPRAHDSYLEGYKVSPSQPELDKALCFKSISDHQ